MNLTEAAETEIKDTPTDEVQAEEIADTNPTDEVQAEEIADTNPTDEEIAEVEEEPDFVDPYLRVELGYYRK